MNQLSIDYSDVKCLKDICELKTGRNIDKKYHKDNGVPYITGASNIQKGIIVTDRFLNPAELKNLSYAVKGDIIVSCVGTITELPKNSFVESGTVVNTALVVVKKKPCCLIR